MRVSQILSGFIVLTFAVVVTTPFLIYKYFEPPLPRFGDAPAFALNDVNGEEVTHFKYRRKAWVASFFFSRCPAVCPTLNKRLATVLEDNAQVQLVSFTIDPENDTSEVLAEYSKKFTKGSERWDFLTGKKSIIDYVLNGFMLGSIEKVELHTTRLVLVDTKGVIRGFYHGMENESVDKLKADLKRVLAE